jgi:hypothetical protein
MAEWFIKVQGKENGPISSQALVRLTRENKIGPETFVRRGTAGAWTRARMIKGLFEETQAVPAQNHAAATAVAAADGAATAVAVQDTVPVDVDQLAAAEAGLIQPGPPTESIPMGPAPDMTLASRNATAAAVPVKPLRRKDSGEPSPMSAAQGGLVIVLLLVLLALPYLSFLHLAPTWEYRVEPLAANDLATKLTELGDEGWELVEMRTVRTSSGNQQELVLKRKK